MNSRSRSALFLMEQLIVILVFAICAAVCVRIFAGAYSTANDSENRRDSLLIAQSAAECFKAARGDMARTAEILGAPVPESPNALIAYYDDNAGPCSQNEAKYLLRVERIPSSGALRECGIAVSLWGGDEILRFASGVTAQ